MTVSVRRQVPVEEGNDALVSRRLDLQEKHLLHDVSRIPLLHGFTNDNFRRLPQSNRVLRTNLMARCKQPATPGEQSTPTLTDNGRF